MVKITTTFDRFVTARFILSVLLFAQSFSASAQVVDEGDWRQRLRQHCAERLSGVDQFVSLDRGVWRLEEATEQKIAELYSATEYDDRDVMNQTLTLMLEDRARQPGSPPRLVMFAHAHNTAHSGSWYDRSIGGWLARYLGAHYNPLFNRVALGTDRAHENPGMALIYGHELTHAFDRNFSAIKTFLTLFAKGWNLNRLILRNPVAPYLHHRMEQSAIGSQWEMVRRMPPAFREKLRKAIVNHQYVTEGLANTRSHFDQVVRSGADRALKRAITKLQKSGVLANEDFDLARVIVSSPSSRTVEGKIKLKFDRWTKGLDDRARVIESIGRADFDLIAERLYGRPDPSGAPPRALPPGARSEKQHLMYQKLKRQYRWSTMTRFQRKYEEIMLESLAAAELDKPSFIARMEGFHGYGIKEMMKRELLNPFGRWQIYLMIQAGYVIATGGHNFAALDVGWILKVLNLY